jgi:hypothetical protein
MMSFWRSANGPMVHALRGKEHEWDNPYDISMTGLIGFSSALELRFARAGQQRVIDLLPGFGADRADRPVQHRLLRAPGVRQPGERPERRRVLEMERQLLIA